MMRKLAIGVGVVLGLAVLGYVALVIYTVLFDDSGTA
jgi:hypothetical protein